MDFSINILDDLASAQSMERGASYHATAKVTKLIKRGEVFEAAVQGSVQYRQTVDLRNEEIQGNCSCPYESGGWCKHLVAVGLAVLGEEYTEVAADFDEEVSEEPIPFPKFWKEYWQAAEERIQLLFMQQLFEKQPDLQAQFLAFVKESEDGVQLVNIDKLRKEIQDEFQTTDIFWEGSQKKNERSYMLKSSFEQIFEAYASKAGDQLDAGRYMDTLRSMLAAYEACFWVKGIEELDSLFDWLLEESGILLYNLSSTVESSILSTAVAKQMIKLIFERWDRFEAIRGDIRYDLAVFAPLIKALTADKVTAHYLKTLLDTYALVEDELANLHSHIASLEEK